MKPKRYRITGHVEYAEYITVEHEDDEKPSAEFARGLLESEFWDRATRGDLGQDVDIDNDEIEVKIAKPKRKADR